MNERIRDLAEQSGYDLTPFYKREDDYQTPHFKDEKLEKFAQLIVKECTNIVLHYTDVDEGVAVTKKHFGVEE